MKTKISLLLTATLLACAVESRAQDATTNAPAAATAPASTPEVSPADEIVPLITVEDAPLTDAIRTLARQAEINLQFDPKVLSGPVGPDGKPLAMPTVSFRWKDITPLQALQAVLDNNNLQLVMDPKTKIARVTTKDPAALDPLVSKVIQLRYSNPTNVIPIIQTSLGTNRSRVIADMRTSQLVIVATEKEQIAINDIISRLDSSPRQILIEARFLETTKNPKSAKGIDWSGTLGAQNVKFGNTTTFVEGLEPSPPSGSGPTATPLFPGVSSGVLGNPAVIADTVNGFGSVGFLNADGVNAVISFLNSDNETETLDTPRTVALEGVQTEISVVQNFPIFEEQQGANTGGTVQPNTVRPNYDLKVASTQLSEVGVKLLVTPRVYGVSNVFLDLKPEISETGPPASTTLSGRVSTAPTFRRKKIETQAMVPTGNTLVLGGLGQDGTINNKTKVPLLGDIPGLGFFFRSSTKERNKRNLLIFITPTILTERDYQYNPEASDFLHQKDRGIAQPDWSSWDNADPASKKKKE